VGRAALGPMRPLLVLSQRPELTGSGITLDALAREAVAAGHEPWVLCGVPAGEAVPRVGGLPADRVLTVTFGDGGDLPFPVPGMSDVMPYPSTVWSAMTTDQLARYREVWRARLADAVSRCRPDVVHCNHLWLVSSLAAEVVGDVPAVAHCHATGLRQLARCPHLGGEILAGLRRHRRFLVPHADLGRLVAATLGVSADRIVEVGAGYREDLFHCRGAPPALARAGQVLYAGKFAAAKGVPWLLDACEAAWRHDRAFALHVAGDGAGIEAEALRARFAALAPRVVQHGRLDQASLGELMRRSSVLVLPSLYEGLPLVLVEGRACGCRLVSTALPGVVSGLAPTVGNALHLVSPPRLVSSDTPVAADLTAFTVRLGSAIDAALAAGPVAPAPGELASFTWTAVFRRVETVWSAVTGSTSK